MPYNKTPSISTYQTKQLKLVAELNSRADSSSTDVDYLNIYPELIKNRVTQQNNISLRKRIGSSSLITLNGATTRGAYYWEDQARLFVAQSDDIYVYSMPSGTLVTTLNAVFGTTSGEVGFTEFLYDDGSVKLVVSDGTTLSTIDTSNTVVASADADMPVHLPNLIFLDGYLFVVKANTADLYNSDLNNPLAWTAGDFISSEIVPDRVSKVVKMNNYILLFGSDSIEYFWDAANDTGSPLQRNDTPVKLTGLIGGVAQIGNKVYFVGDNDKSQATVYIMEDFKITPIASEPIRRWLSSNTSSTLYANIISIDGHDFYVLYLNDKTYVMELETQLWHRWGWQSLDYFNIQFALNCRTSTSYTPVFIKLGTAAVYKFDSSIYQDDGSNIVGKMILDNEEFETYNQKTMSGLCIWADRTSGSNELLVQWSDDDYQTFNTGITLELNQESPDIKRLGRFRRRAFKFTHTSNKPLRIKNVEVDINLGIN